VNLIREGHAKAVKSSNMLHCNFRKKPGQILQNSSDNSFAAAPSNASLASDLQRAHYLTLSKGRRC